MILQSFHSANTTKTSSFFTPWMLVPIPPFSSWCFFSWASTVPHTAKLTQAVNFNLKQFLDQFTGWLLNTRSNSWGWEWVAHDEDPGSPLLPVVAPSYTPVLHQWNSVLIWQWGRKNRSQMAPDRHNWKVSERITLLKIAFFWHNQNFQCKQAYSDKI